MDWSFGWNKWSAKSSDRLYLEARDRVKEMR